MKTTKLGWLPDLPDTRDQIFAAERPRDFTRIHDQRWDNSILPMRDQGKAGSCTGFGVTLSEYAAMVMDKTYTVPPFHPSELYAYWVGRRNKSEDTGASIRDVIKGTVTHGVAPAYLWLYKDTNVLVKPPDRAFEEAKKFITIKYARVRHDLKEILYVLGSGYPIVFGHLVHENFWKIGPDGIVPLPKGRIDGGHCQGMIGYNRDKFRILCANSWGKGHGDRGYDWFHFDHILNPEITMDLWVIYEISI